MCTVIKLEAHFILESLSEKCIIEFSIATFFLNVFKSIQVKTEKNELVSAAVKRTKSLLLSLFLLFLFL